MKKILLIDGFWIIFKSYYAFINRPLTNKNGENTSAIFGFFKSILSILNREKPDYYLIAFEGKGGCFRKEIYPDYKANRQEPPEDLKEQIYKIFNLVNKLNIPNLSIKHHEADDVIGTIATKSMLEEDKTVSIFSSDKDFMQLVNEKVTIIRPRKFSEDNEILDKKAVINKVGINPCQIIDYLALVGDTSDNIPGVKGIGPKTASSLLQQWNDLNNIYDNLDSIISNNVKTKLEQNKDNAFLSKKLATIKKDIDITINWNEFKTKPFNINNAISLFEKEDLKNIINSISKYNTNNFNKNKLDIDTSKNLTKQNESSNFKSLKRKYLFIFKKEELKKKIKSIESTGHFCFDLETTGFNSFSDKIICISIALKNDVFIIPFHISPTQQKELNIEIEKTYLTKTIELLKTVFQNKNILKIGHNIKFDIKFLENIGISVKGSIFDTMLAEYCLDASHNIFSMDDLAKKYLSYKTIHYKDVITKPKEQTLQDISIDKLSNYSGEDADITLQLYNILENKLNRNEKTKKLFYEIEMPLLKILVSMELKGVSINKNYLTKLSKLLEKEILIITDKIMKISNQNFNLNSSKQIGEILFNKLKLPVIKKTKTGPSTDVDVLTKLSYIHPIASLLLEYRTINKIKSTYSDSLPKIINDTTKKIHTTYLQTGTQTGRLASKDPNLQNIPIKTDLGRKIRQAFIPSSNNILVGADYSQIELFLLAEFSKDPNLMEAFNKNKDIHQKTASLIFGKKPEDITNKERNVGKTINFSILYGQGAFRLAENLKISKKEAAIFINLYFEKYSYIKKYMEKLKNECKKNGHAQTYWGRIRTIPEIYDKNKMKQANGERMSINTTIQGTAADLIKIAMIKICNKFKQENIFSKLITQVHDELIFDVIPKEKEKVISIIKDCMENGFNFHLQLKTTIKTGKDWGELK